MFLFIGIYFSFLSNFAHQYEISTVYVVKQGQFIPVLETLDILEISVHYFYFKLTSFNIYTEIISI